MPPSNLTNRRETTVLFVSLPTRAISVTMPISYIYLDAYLEKKGISSEILDIKRIARPGGRPIFSLKETLEKILKEITIRKPKYIGFTCFTSDFNSIMNIGRLIKDRLDTKIIVGGIHPTLKPEDFFHEGSPIDIAVIGEGELTLSELIKKGLSGGEIDNVPGIMFRRGDRIIRTADRPYMMDLSDMPLPAYHKIDMNFYMIPQQSLVRWLFLSGFRIFTTRGCPYPCTFCANRAQMVRHRPVHAVIDEIKFLRDNYGSDGFYVQDDTFCMDRRRTFEFLDVFRKNGLDDMVWGIETRVNLLDEEMIDALKRAGCIQVDLGIESGSQEMLDRTKKGIRVEDAVRTFEICRRYKMRTFACFMVNMPGETEEHINESVKLMRRIKATVYGINITIPHIGTQIYEDYVKPKLTVDEYDKFIYDNSFKPLADKRFRLTNHNLNEKYVYYVKFKRFGLIKNIVDITLQPAYWKMVLGSKRKRLYATQFLWALIYKLFVYPIKLLLTVNLKFYE